MPSHTFETPGAVRLNIAIPSGRVEIETADVNETHVELEALSDAARELLGETRIDSRERPGGHEVIVEVPQRTSFFLGFGRGAEFRLRVACPEGADLDVRTKSADLQARGRYGAAEIKTASGDISLDEAQEARIKTASGDVALDTIHGITHVQSASGDLSLQRAGGDATVQLVSGDVWIRDAGASVHANTVSGSTNSELELSDAPAEDGGGEGDEGPMVELRIKTVSGDVNIARAAAPAQLPRH